MLAYPPTDTVQRARDLTEADRSAIVEDLRRAGAGEVRSDRFNRLLYATDASLYQMEPVAVVFPTSTADVQSVLRVAAKARVPVMPRGGGTGLSGQTVNHAIVMDFTRAMNNLLEVNVEEQWVRVQPGVVLSELNRQIARHGLLYGIDPSTQNRATIGGGVGNNSCGAHSVVYGKTIDQVVELQAVLSDASVVQLGKLDGPALEAKLRQDGLEGELYREMRRIGQEQHEEIERRFPKIMRRVSGYNLDDFVNDSGPMDMARMVVGSEGTLAVVTEAKLRLNKLPKVKGLAAAHFRTLVEAAEATVAALEHAVASIELIDSVVIERCRASFGFHHLADFVQGTPGGLLLIEMAGDSEAEVLSKIEALKADLDRKGLGYYTLATTDPAVQRDIWRMREAGQGLITSVRGAKKAATFVEDAAVAPEKLPAYIKRFQEIVESNNTTAAYYGHASVGCLHIRPMVNPKTSAGLDQMEKIATEVADLVLEFGGSLSGEHGDGIVRGVFTERMFGPTLTNAFREVKQTFDPNSLLNPGKIIDTPGFRENLRLEPDGRTWEPVTYLDFSFEGGLAAAADQCNGQGACRKHEGGMCPSYMVTQEEEHSTRGRANLLRLTMSGALPQSELTGDRMFDALDLCVECKACKSECPTGVDMAKLKYEVLAQRNKAQGVPLRARVFANIAMVSKLTAPFGGIANFFGRQKPLRALMQKYAGIARERPLPAFASQTFPSWFGKRASGRLATRGDAVLFHDTFTDYYHPEVGQAAVRILEALGYRVVVVEKTGCCGRPAISKGLLPTAKACARKNVDALLPYAQRGVPLVGTEPSCLLTFRDEYPDLLRDESSKVVAGQALLLDELIVRLAQEDPEVLKEAFRDDMQREVLLHAHCHQKAIVGPEPTLQALRQVPGYKVSLVETSCCGMAGSFGFEAEHYEVSKAMGSLRLFPAVEAASTDTQIAITGVSCRQQIGHFTSRKPRHALEVLADALR
ncbi:MAG TPA: FAD-linked oxidase C-terminal domain-containing protein [Dehalococcoidia bacterium]|nr:FAD-linked oxidase C-terminal domain-containing protein [Dehalococcoidia bacterium]